MNKITNRLYTSSVQALPKAGQTSWWLLKIIIPISLIVSLLQYWGIIAQFASVLAPAFSLIGLPGESAIVFISSFFLPLYAPIAILATLTLNLREITILALMCLISHNMIVETAIQKKTGSSAFIMFTLRICSSFIAAIILNWLLPAQMGSVGVAHKLTQFLTFSEMLTAWVVSAGWLVFKITLIVTGLMMLQSIMKEFKVLDFLAKLLSPFMRIMGLSDNSSFLWFVSQTLGLTYGSAIVLEAIEKHEIEAENANLLNYHIALNHSLLEDTLLFVAIGVPAGWLVIPRFAFAIAVVWFVRLMMKIKSS